jgi:integrase
MVELIAATKLRIGELLALRWRALDLEIGTLAVRESVYEGKVPTWHQFRQIHSSLLNDLRVPVRIAQEQLGHASIQTTLNIYTHVVDASRRAAIESLEQRLFQLFPSRRKRTLRPNR